MEELEESLLENRRLKAELLAAENRMLQESLEVLGSYVDPREAFRGPEGNLWQQIGAIDAGEQASSYAFSDERQLAEARAIGRMLERTNEFAINGHENRVSYIVGCGHVYEAEVRKGRTAPPELAGEVQAVIDEFTRVNQWPQRQQEIVRRRDRDGEVFLRLFVGEDGITRVRFIEPGQVFRPTHLAGSATASFGIETDPDDVETVLAYWVDGKPVDAAEIQHRKLGVDRNVKRGIPLFHCVRHNLRRAEKLLQNMATVADIQTAIAMIRRHDRVAKTAAEVFRSGTAASMSMESGGAATYYSRFSPGTILDVPKSTEYDFPAAGIDASRYVLVLQAILRSVASRLVFPEFMLTSDASNANYSSTLVAEGPAVKTFERWQAEMRGDDLEILERVIAAAVRGGRLPVEALSLIAIQVGLPRVSTRDEKATAETNAIYHALGVKSRRTIASELGLDYHQERVHFAHDGDLTDSGATT